MSALAELDVWRDRYRMCVATDPRNSDRRWRAVAGWAAAHVELEPAEADELGYGLSDDARDWLELADYAKMFSVKVQT